MANHCYFEMKIKGREEDRDELLSVFENGKEGLFFRIYDFEIMSSDNESIAIYGNCAWSVFSSMIDEHLDPKLNLVSESQRLNLEIEIYSQELGIGFQEHYLIKKGEILEEECIDTYLLYVGECVSKDAAEEEYECTISEVEWEKAQENGGDIIRGGFDEWSFSI